MILYSERQLKTEYDLWVHEQLRIQKRTGVKFEIPDIEVFRRDVYEPTLEEVYKDDAF
ncbi:hypothetical protein [Phenylobacterium sp.]|uniref:hypothetical protein n=1 Tax=Phenylobacterium sp. TaxID=1871053 RepID=UPI0025D5DE20|nr:hypothetical protein [Phenylobacterium sp.]